MLGDHGKSRVASTELHARKIIDALWCDVVVFQRQAGSHSTKNATTMIKLFLVSSEMMNKKQKKQKAKKKKRKRRRKKKIQMVKKVDQNDHHHLHLLLENNRKHAMRSPWNEHWPSTAHSSSKVSSLSLNLCKSEHLLQRLYSTGRQSNAVLGNNHSATDCRILMKFGRLVHGPCNQNRELLAGRVASSGYAALIATLASIIKLSKALYYTAVLLLSVRCRTQTSFCYYSALFFRFFFLFH